jgi:hypothetical protein
MVNIFYGKSHFPDIAERDILYIDRTEYLEKLERSGADYVIFLRPRRFGKSLWISIMRHYYGIEYKDRFEYLFGKYYIGKQPTANANQYLILAFDFSGIESEDKNVVFRDFFEKTKGSVSLFLSNYKTFFDKEATQFVLSADQPSTLVFRLFALVRTALPDKKIYLLIDEYDHFANQLMAYQLNDFKEVVSKGGFVRVFYETLKEAVGQGIIGRVFITGVSPITLDSLTSGFNIADDFSLDVGFHNMMGFDNNEVRGILQLLDIHGQDLDDYNELLKTWYDGYKFNPDAADFIYNPDMVLYFATHFNRNRKPPEKMLDTNIASSYSRIRAMFRLPRRGTGEFENLQELLENREVLVNVTQIFNFELEFTTSDFLSLLFYMGFLTVKGKIADKWLLQMPNRVIEHLYHKYFIQLLSEKTHYVRGIDTLEKALDALILYNDPTLLANLITYTLTNLSGRDVAVSMEIREKNVQVLLFSFLSFSQAYLVESEYNAQGQYFDILATAPPNYNMPFNFLFELKYLPKSSAKKVKEEYAKAQVQIANYQHTPKIQQLLNLKAWIIIVVGTEVKICKPA